MKLIFSNKELERVVYEGFKALYPDLEFCSLDVGFDIDEGQSKITVVANYTSVDSGEKQAMPYSKKLDLEKEKEVSRREMSRKLLDIDKDEDETGGTAEEERSFNIFNTVEAPF